MTDRVRCIELRHPAMLRALLGVVVNRFPTFLLLLASLPLPPSSEEQRYANIAESAVDDLNDTLLAVPWGANETELDAAVQKCGYRLCAALPADPHASATEAFHALWRVREVARRWTRTAPDSPDLAEGWEAELHAAVRNLRLALAAAIDQTRGMPRGPAYNGLPVSGVGMTA